MGPSSFRLVGPGPRKIAVIKALREVTGWGLKEAKDFVDASERAAQNLPTNAADPAAVEYLAQQLMAAGALVERG